MHHRLWGMDAPECCCPKNFEAIFNPPLANNFWPVKVRWKFMLYLRTRYLNKLRKFVIYIRNVCFFDYFEWVSNPMIRHTHFIGGKYSIIIIRFHAVNLNCNLCVTVFGQKSSHNVHVACILGLAYLIKRTFIYYYINNYFEAIFNHPLTNNCKTFNDLLIKLCQENFTFRPTK